MIRLDQPEYKRIEFIAQSGPDYVSFSQGALRTGGVPQAIREYAREILTTDAADYYTHPLGIALLREKIAHKLSLHYNIQVNKEHISVTHGSINAISSLCLALLNIGDEVLIPEPTYPAYVNIVKIAKAQPVFVQAFVEGMQQDGQKKWKFDVDRVKKATTVHTKMIIIPNPANPCGVCLTNSELLELKQWSEQHGIYLIFDEVYDNYIFDGAFASGTALAVESELVFRIGSFSKDFAMSGWRIGFIVAQPSILPALMAVQDGLICCPNAIGQYAAAYALDHYHLMKPQIEQISRNRLLTVELLEPLVRAGILSFIKPDAGFFYFLKTEQEDTTQLVNDILDKAHVALVPGKDFGPSGKSYIRLCYARNEGLIHKGIERLINYFKV